MRDTQDLILARLREHGRRWRAEQGIGASEGTSGQAAPEPTESSGVPGPGPGNARVPWFRLVALLAGLALSGAAVAGFLAWPRVPASPPSAAAGEGGRSPEEPTDTPVVAGVGDPFAVASPTAAATIVVHVVGEVREPGVVRLPAGSRVLDAVDAAGGLRRRGSVGGLNLARVLSDGERVEVGPDAPVEAPVAGSAPVPGGGDAPSRPLDLNTASAEQLDGLPGIGPVTATKILAWRSEHGRFTTVDELAEVSGIGPKTLEELRPHVRV